MVDAVLLRKWATPSGARNLQPKVSSTYFHTYMPLTALKRGDAPRHTTSMCIAQRGMLQGGGDGGMSAALQSAPQHLPYGHGGHLDAARGGVVPRLCALGPAELYQTPLHPCQNTLTFQKHRLTALQRCDPRRSVWCIRTAPPFLRHGAEFMGKRAWGRTARSRCIFPLFSFALSKVNLRRQVQTGAARTPNHVLGCSKPRGSPSVRSQCATTITLKRHPDRLTSPTTHKQHLRHRSAHMDGHVTVYRF